MVSSSDRRTTDTRVRLIDAAIESFVHIGPGNTSWGDVCAAADTTKGVVQHHFPGGKEELVVAAVERNAAVVDTFIAHVLETSTSPAEALVHFFDLYASLLDEDPDRGCPIAASVVDASATSAAVRAATARAFTRWMDRLAELIDDSDVATTVVAAMEGSILLARVTRDPDLVRRTARVLAAKLLA